MEISEAEGTMAHVGGAAGVTGAIPEEEISELSLEGLVGAHDVMKAWEVLRTEHKVGRAKALKLE